MAMGDLDKVLSFDQKSTVPDLDWLSLQPGDVKNIPVPMNVEVLPQLQQAWASTDTRGPQRISTYEVAQTVKKSSVGDAVIDVVRSAKRAMMLGHTGRSLADKLAGLYSRDVICASKDALTKLAAEQGLLGNVYIDMEAFDSCDEAVKMLGKNKIRTAKYVVGSPKKRACNEHKTGFCRDLRKKVVAEVLFDDSLFSHYSDHLKIAGVMSADETISSKDQLRECFFRIHASKDPQQVKAEEESGITITAELEQAFSNQLDKDTEKVSSSQQVDRFQGAQPILAHIQNEMLKGIMGDELKNSISKKFAKDQIAAYEPEIRRVASLQGLLGNVYVDVSYYKSASEAISAIKSAITSPQYVIQTISKGQFDDTLNKVARATGCKELPRDGKIDLKIASSYLDDLSFCNRISSDVSKVLRKKLEAGDNALSIIRDAYLATQGYRPEKREAGVSAFYNTAYTTGKQSADRSNLKTAAYKALESGISIDKVEDKLTSFVPTVEAVGLVRNVLSSMRVVNAASLVKCTTEKYQLNKDVRIVKASKCTSCVRQYCSTCTALNAKFAGKEVVDKAFLDLDPKTAKVLYGENPDVARVDMSSERDTPDSFGSGMNIALDNIREKKALDIDLGGVNDGMDLSTL